MEEKEKKEEKVIEVVKGDTQTTAPKNNMALAGFICSLVGFITCGIVSIVGFVLSIIGLNKSKQLNGEGKGFAVAGIVIGAIEIVVTIIVIILFCIFVVAAGSSSKIIYDDVLSDRNYMQEVYDNIDCTTYYCTVASDGSYLEIDTNPSDIEDFSSTDAWEMVKDANDEFGFSEALNNKMNQTRALDGTQSDENSKVEVTWTYHPDDGLEVTYSLK